MTRERRHAFAARPRCVSRQLAHPYGVLVQRFESVPDLQWVDLSGDVAPGGVWYYDLAPFNSACGAEGPR